MHWKGTTEEFVAWFVAPGIDETELKEALKSMPEEDWRDVERRLKNAIFYENQKVLQVPTKPLALMTTRRSHSPFLRDQHRYLNDLRVEEQLVTEESIARQRHKH